MFGFFIKTSGLVFTEKIREGEHISGFSTLPKHSKSYFSFAICLLIFLNTNIHAKSSIWEKNAKTINTLTAIYHDKGEDALREWMKLNAGIISDKLVLEMVKKGVKDRSDDIINICLILAEEKNSKKCSADVYLEAGNYFHFISDNIKSISLYENALGIYIELKDLSGECNAYLKKGSLYLIKGDYDKALLMFEKALPLAKKALDIKSEGSVYKGIGDIYYYKDDLNKALELYEKALPFFLKAKDIRLEGDIYKSEGDLYFYEDDLNQSKAMYDKALALYEASGNELGMANIFEGEGQLYFFKGDNDKAFQMNEKALKLYEKLRDRVGQGSVYKNKGDIFYYSGNNTEALEMYDKALPFFEKAENIIGQGNIYHMKGEIYLNYSDNTKAFEMFERALTFHKQAQSLLGQGNVYFREGDIYFKTGDDAKALEMFDKAKSFYENAKSLLSAGNVCIREGNIYQRLENYDKAIEMYDKAISLFKSIEEPRGLGTAYRCKGDIFLERGDFAKAAEMFNMALPLFKKINSPLGEGNAYQSIGELYLKQGNIKRAREMYTNALVLYRKIGDIDDEANALFGNAKTYESDGKPAEALPFYEDAIKCVEKVRAQTAFSELKKSYMKIIYEDYENATIFMADNGYEEQAFHYAESLKGRAFLDSLAEGMVDLEKGVSSELKSRRDNLLKKQSEISRAINDAVESGDENEAETLKKDFDAAQEEFEKLQIEIRLKNPLYASVRYPEPVSLDSFQKQILKPGETMVEYFVSKDSIYVFVVTQNRFKTIKLALSRKDISAMLRAYLGILNAQQNKSNNYSLKEIAPFSIKLYNAIIKPIESYITEKSALIIVPDGELALLPFEILITGTDKNFRNPKYLLEKYPIKYIQSASVLSIMRNESGTGRQQTSFIGFGDPVYDYDHFIKGEPETGGSFNRLIGSGEELRRIAKLFEETSGKQTVKIREDAREEFAKSPDISGYSYIHFACHGILDRGFQSLVLSQIPNSKEDGYLTLGEIMNCHYNACLVVLSACKTGHGKIEKGEGITGLTRAVMYAGSPSAVVSLWSVSDQSTMELMVNFYRNMLQKKMNKSDSLRSAKMKMLKSKIYAHPFFWGAFIMYGE